MDMPPATDEIEVLLFEESPYGPHLAALVQTDGRTVYFFLHGEGAFGTRACWVRNLQPGPWVFSEDDLRQGRPPLLPKVHTAPAVDWTLPDRDRLHVVWFPQGNGAFLLENDDVLAVLPPWSGRDGFHGYARDCTSENLVCWPLPARAEWATALRDALAYWETWDRGRLFEVVQPQLLARYQARFGEVWEYYSIDGGRFPPRGAACFQGAAATLVLTVGMSLCPQPNIPVSAEGAPQVSPQIELGMRLPRTTDRDQVFAAVQRLAGVARLPWTQWTWLGAGQMIDIAGPGMNTPYQLVADDQADLLWLVPGDRS